MKDSKEKKQKEENVSCDLIEGCKTMEVVDMPANKKIMNMTKNFINSIFTHDKKSSDDSNS